MTLIKKRVTAPAAIDIMELRGKLRFEFDFNLQTKRKSLKGKPREKKVRKKRKTCKLIQLLPRAITELAQDFIIALGAAKAADLLKNHLSGISWIIVGIIMIGLMFVKALSLAPSR